MKTTCFESKPEKLIVATIEVSQKEILMSRAFGGASAEQQLIDNVRMELAKAIASKIMERLSPAIDKALSEPSK